MERRLVDRTYFFHPLRQIDLVAEHDDVSAFPIQSRRLGSLIALF